MSTRDRRSSINPNKPEIEGRRYSQIISLNLQKLDLQPSESHSFSSQVLQDQKAQSVCAKSFLSHLDRYGTKHEYTIDRYNQIREENRKQEEKNRFTRKLSLLYRFTFHLVSNLINITAVIVYIVQTFIDNESSEFYSESLSDTLTTVEFCFTLFFLVEYCWQIHKKRHRLVKYLLSFDSMIDIITIIPSIISFFYIRNSVSVGYIRIFRVFRVFRILRIYKSLKVIQIENLDNLSDVDVAHKLDPVKLKFFTILIVIFCTVFIGSGVLLSVQELFPGSLSQKDMNFVDAFYFMLTSLTTIGYGDILPTSLFTRIIFILTLVVFIVLVSDQVTQLGHLLRVWGNGVYSYTGEDHYILIANKTQFTKIFLEMIRITEEETPVLVLCQDGTEFISKEYPFNKVSIMKVEKLDGEILDYANSKFSKGIFLFNEQSTENYLMQEKKLEYLQLKIRYFHGKLKVPVYIQNLVTDGKSNLAIAEEEFKLQYNRSTPIALNKAQMMAKSCFIPGFSTLMQNLAFNRYDLPADIDYFPFVIRFYLLGCQSRLRICKFPLYFIGKEFINCSIAVYYKSISDYLGKVAADKLNLAHPVLLIGLVEYNLAGEELIKLYPNDTKIKKNSLGIFICNEDKDHLDNVLSFFRKRDKKKKVFISSKTAMPEEKQNDEFPRQMETDRGLLKTESLNPISPKRKAIAFSSSKRKLVNLREIVLSKYIEDDSILESSNQEFNSIAEIVADRPSHKEEKAKLRKLTMENLNVLRNAEEGDRSELASQLLKNNIKYYAKPNSFEANEELNQYTVENRIIDIEKHDQSSQIMNHFLLIGVQECLEQLISFLSIHFENSQFCVLSNKNRDDRIIRLLKKYRNLRYFKGNQLNPLSLKKAGIERCRQVIFLPENIDSKENEDIVNILSYRAIDYFYDTNVKIDLWDSKNQRLIGYIPLDTDSTLGDNEYLHPKFMAGESVLSNQFGKLLATVATNPIEYRAWAQMLSLGTVPAKEQWIDKKYYKIEPTVLSLNIPKSYEGEDYSVLCHDLFKLEDPAIPLGLYIENPLKYLELRNLGNVYRSTRYPTRNELKIKLSHKKKLKYSEDAYKKEKPFLNICSKMKKMNKFDKVVLDFVDAKQPHLPVFITNPPPSFPLIAECSVTVLSLKREQVTPDRIDERPEGRGTGFYDKKIAEMLKVQEKFNKIQKEMKEKFEARFRKTSGDLISSMH